MQAKQAMSLNEPLTAHMSFIVCETFKSIKGSFPQKIASSLGFFEVPVKNVGILNPGCVKITNRVNFFINPIF